MLTQRSLPWLLVAALVAYIFYAEANPPAPKRAHSPSIGTPRAPSISSAGLSGTETLKTIRIPDKDMSDLPELDLICYVYENRSTGQSHMACPTTY